VKIFDREGNFAALDDAEIFLAERGFSYALLDGSSPIGVMFTGIGNKHHYVPKWRHIEREEIGWLHGRLESDNWRAGPVILRIRKDAPAAVLEAVRRL